jgi:hypothetical protein
MSFKTRVTLGRAALLVLAWSALSHLRLGLPDFASVAQAAGVEAPGGLVEKSNSTVVRTRLSAAQVAAMLPDRGGFTFPAPYNTEAARLTNSADCNGGDCVNSVGYSYWNNMNNSAGSNTLLAFVALNRSRGGGGPTLFQYDKTTGEVRKLGPIFDSTSPYANGSGEGWYFSSTLPNALYVFRGMTLQRYDVMTRTLTTVFDATTQFGAGNYIWQLHSSHDDRVHSGTLRASSGSTPLGCFAYLEDSRIFKWYPKIGDYDECQIDASGRFLQIKENVDGLSGVDNRVIDLQTGVDRRHPWPSGAPGHSDVGYGYTVGQDAWNNLPNAYRVYPFDQDSWASAPVVYNNMDWSVVAPGHVSHTNARPGTPLSQQYACGSGANRSNTNRANEILCFRLDSTLDVLVVAPVMTDLDATGGQDGDDYYQQPKGNLDPTGQFFMWTTNMGGARQDAFIVRVPSELLVTGVGTVADVIPPAVTAIQAGADPTSANIAWTTSEPADSQVDYGPTTAYGTSTVRNGTMVTSHAQGLSGLVSGTQYHFRVRSRDAAGNQSVSADQVFTTSTNAPAAGPSAWWKLDEAAGPALVDATGAGHSGLLVNGPARIAGRTGLALAFDGVNDSATVPHEASLDAYPLSASFWMKTGATGLSAVVNKYAAASLNGWQVFTNGGSLCAWYFRNATNYVWDGGGCTLAVAGVNDNQWHHVAFAVDAGGGRLYVDGALRASRGWTGTPGPATTTQPLTFASYPGTAAPPLAGALDDVRVYGRALGASEIAALAGGPAPDLTAPVIGPITTRVLLTGALMVSWQTSEMADTRLEYGLTMTYGSTTALATTPVQSHNVVLAGLLRGRLYHCRAISRDAAGNTALSVDYTFMTPSAGTAPPADQVTP